jgi:phosphotransferase system HPr (HPr) family protein
MVEQKVTITNKMGLHLRAAYLLVETASAFASEIYLCKNGVEVDAKSILGLLGLEGSVWSEVTVKAKGPDEKAALESVVKLIENKFNEGE